MGKVPYHLQKRLGGAALLLLLAIAAYFSLSRRGTLRGFDPATVEDERLVRIASLEKLIALDPSDYRTHAELARLYFALGDWDRAERSALAAIEHGRRKNAPKSFLMEQLLLLAQIEQKKGNAQKALEYATRAAELEPQKAAPLKRRGQVYEQMRKNDKARLEYLRALKLDEKDPETYALLANQEFRKGNRKAALEWLRMGVRRNPKSGEAFRNLARGYLRTGDTEKARQAYERALELEPDNANIRHEYARLLQKLGDQEGYLTQLKKAHASDPHDPKILADLADAELAAGNRQKALELYREAFRRDSRNPQLKEKYQRLYDSLLAESGERREKSIQGPAKTATEQTVSQTAPSDGGSGTATNSSSQNIGGISADDGPKQGHGTHSGAQAKAMPADAGLGQSPSGLPQNITPDIEAGKKSFEAKDYATAEAHFRKALEKDPNSAEARYLLARSLDLQGKKEAAIAEYRRAIEKEPEHARAHYYIGRLLYQAQKYAEAERSFARAAKADSKFAAAHYSQGLALDKMGKTAEALSAYRKATETDPNLREAYFNSAILLKKQQRYDEALAALERSGPGSDTEYQRGEILLKQKKFEAARAAFERVLAEKPQHYEAAFNLALTYHKLGNPAGADKILSRVIRDDSPADLHYTYGKLLEESTELAAAEKQYRTSVSKDPRYYKGWINLGRVAAAQQKYDQAEQAYRQAVLLEPGSYEANLNLGNVLFKQKKYDQAAEYFEAARRLEATREVVLPLAQSYENAGEAEKAAKVYSDFLRQHPKDQTALERLGYLYYRKMRDNGKALEQFNKLLQYYPDSAKAQEYRAMVQLIEKQTKEQ
ncbi:MAG: tetratricopeptide repeat protein [Turneriella sp.]|nr:tetratricopeptide repeat protein [Turneriella sp.]